MNTGSEAYMSNMASEKDKEKQNKLYQRVPRMVVSPSSIDISSDQLSNPNIMGKMVDHVLDVNDELIKTQKIMNVRRVSLQHLLSAKVYFSNIFEYYKFTEILLMVVF